MEVDHETRFSCDQQAAAIDDSRHFVRYMASPELFDMLDMDSVGPAEGYGYESNLRMHTTRLITDHMHTMMNKALGIDLYSSDEISTLYRQGEPFMEQATKRQKIETSQDVHTFGEQYKGFHSYENHVKEKLMRELAPSEPITDKDLQRETITIRHGNLPFTLKIRIENYVYVTYLCNKNDPRKRCKINLLDMAAKTLMFGVQHSTNKFSKNDMRNKHGSTLTFESGVFVETGCTNPLLAAKLLEHTMNIFRYVCGYYDIGIWERRCHNVVATGSLNFGLCLELLKDRYPFVTYEKEDFAGAIICIDAIDMYNERLNGASTSSNKTNTSNGMPTTIFDDTEQYVNNEKNRLNPDEEYNRKYNNIGSEAEQRERDMIQSMLSSSTTNTTSTSTNGVSQYEPVYDEFDITHLLRNTKATNVKALVFPHGRVICVGNKSREGVIESYAKLFPFLESCRDTPENVKEEKRIARAKKQNMTGRKRKRASSKTKKEVIITVKCRYCDFNEPASNFRSNKMLWHSDNATMCDQCEHSVWKECAEQIHCDTSDEYVAFCCPDCGKK